MTVARAMQQTLVIACAALLVASASAAPCPGACKCYTSDNGIQSANCTGLPDQATAAWPQKNLRIRLGDDRASPVVLEDRAFRHFPRLTCLDVADMTVQYVAASAFGGLPELLELNLVGAGIRRLHRDTFAGNRKLAFLSLRRNPRLSVGPAFLVSDSVTELDVSACGLTTLKSVYFRGLTNLKYLFAADNELRVLGPQFGPPGLKYVSLARNRIETVREDLETYKRLRTVDLTGNPVNCTCELSEADRRLSARGVALGNTVACANTGKPLGDLAEVCAADGQMMGDEPADVFQADGLLRIDQKQWQSMAGGDDDLGSGSGSGDDDGLAGATSAAPEGTTAAAVAGATASSSTEGPAGEVVVVVGRVEPTAGTSSAANGTSTARSGADAGIVPLTIQAPEDGNRASGGDGDRGDRDVRTKVAEYLKTNVGVTGTAVVLAVVIVAIVYKAVCVGKKIGRDDAAAANEKSVELKEIKYMAADTEDSRDRHRHIDSPSDGSAEENHLLEGDSDDDDDDGDEDDGDGADARADRRGPPPVNSAGNGDARNGDLLNSVMDAVKSTSGNARPADGPDVPTRVVVKLGETPKTSKPVAIDNVQ